MPLLGNKRSSSSSTAPQFPTSTPPKAPPLSQQQQQSAISPNLPVNDYVMSQIKHSLQFLVANQAITPYKSARIGALLDAGTNDEEVLTDMARFKPKAKGESENEEELGPVATWFQDTVSGASADCATVRDLCYNNAALPIAAFRYVSPTLPPKKAVASQPEMRVLMRRSPLLDFPT